MPVTAAAIKEKAEDAAKAERELTALRHFVYSDLSTRLRTASEDQTMTILSNLRLTENRAFDFGSFPTRMLSREFLLLAVSPDVHHWKPSKKRQEIERVLIERYGERLLDVPGFYRNDKGEIKLALPKRCGLLFYHNSRGLLAGVACLPLGESGFYWLLSSKRYGGPKATAMMPESRKFLDRHLEN